MNKILKTIIILICSILAIPVYAYATVSHTIQIKDDGHVLSSYSGTGRYRHGSSASITYTENKPVKKWLEFANGKYVPLSEDINLSDFAVNENKILVPNADFTITLDLNGGTGIEDTTIEYDFTTETFSLETPVFEDHTFLGWTGSNGDTPQKNVVIKQYTGGDRHYTANWKQDEKEYVLVRFDTGTRGQKIADKYVEKGTSIEEDSIEVPRATGYQYTGWHTDPQCTLPYDFSRSVTSNMTLYTSWKIAEYTVTFDMDNKGETPQEQTVLHMGLAERPEIVGTVEGYRFGGWYKEKTYTNIFDFGNEYITGDTVIYAKWIPNTYTVTFDSNMYHNTRMLGKHDLSGTMETEVFAYGEKKALTTNDFVLKGCNFIKWNTKIDGTGVDYTDKEVVQNLTSIENGNIILYAQWEPVPYTVVIDFGGLRENITSDVMYYGDKIFLNKEDTSSYDSKYIKLPTGLDTEQGTSEYYSENLANMDWGYGYYYKGLYTDKEYTNEFSEGDIITGDTTLYAKYEPVILHLVYTPQVHHVSDFYLQYNKSLVNYALRYDDYYQEIPYGQETELMGINEFVDTVDRHNEQTYRSLLSYIEEMADPHSLSGKYYNKEDAKATMYQYMTIKPLLFYDSSTSLGKILERIDVPRNFIGWANEEDFEYDSSTGQYILKEDAEIIADKGTVLNPAHRYAKSGTGHPEYIYSSYYAKEDYKCDDPALKKEVYPWVYLTALFEDGYAQVTLPNAPEKDGYMFAGWYAYNTSSENYYLGMSGSTANIKTTAGSMPIYPKYEKIPEVTGTVDFTSSTNAFTLKHNNKQWKGKIEYSIDDSEFSVWSGSSIYVPKDSVLHMRGYGNTRLTNGAWVLTGKNIACSGNIENLLDCRTVALGKHPEMDSLCFSNMFKDCTGLITAPELPATTLSDYCYNGMFSGCTSLAEVPELPAEILTSNCYNNMFYGCTSLTEAPELPATTLTDNCYNSMFSGCTALVEAPELPAEALTSNCYNNMFYGCTSLREAPSSLPATTLTDNCYNHMFYNCTSLTEAPELPATTLTDNCYNSMFYNCASMTKAPSSLPAIVLTDSCYNGMFYGCALLTEVPQLPATTLTNNCYNSMFYGCASLVEAPELPAEILASNCYNSMFYGCTSMTKTPSSLPATVLPANCYNSMFYGCKLINEIPDMNITEVAEKCCYRMFYQCKQIEEVPQQMLPATTMKNECYSHMFHGCSALTQAPSLPAMDLASNCYNSMFYGCSSLVQIPQLPATTLANNCYNSMFCGCTSLREAPELPATTLASNCYNNMFSGCKLLAAAPELPAETLTGYCYNSMFYGCTSLREAPELPATKLADHCYNSMFSGCKLLAAAPELPVMTLTSNCYNSMFYGCTSLTTAPELPATAVSYYGYTNMFYGCTSLREAPELPATTLSTNCYEGMFYGCTSLREAPELPARNLATGCYTSMFYGTSLREAPSLPATRLTASCYKSMFSGCRSLTEAPALPATTLAANCYEYMFNNCTSLKVAPQLPATNLADSCYANMFSYSGINTLPALYSSTMKNSCYYRMFYGCYSLYMSESESSVYKYEYRIPYNKEVTGTESTSALSQMFTSTGGSFKGTPVMNKIYYTKEQPIE